MNGPGTLRSLADHVAGCTPERVGAALARALALALCRERRHRPELTPCAECASVGRSLAPTVGRALFKVRQHGLERPLAMKDFAAVGAALEVLERDARTDVRGATVVRADVS